MSFFWTYTSLWSMPPVSPPTPPHTHISRCWAQGMDGWKPVEQIAQLKWSVLATGSPLLNESEMAALILSMFTRMCKFYPSRWANVHTAQQLYVWLAPYDHTTYCTNFCHVLCTVQVWLSSIVVTLKLELLKLCMNFVHAMYEGFVICTLLHI